MIKERDRVVGGIPTSEYPDCVAIGSSDGWCCTGTLIAPNVVITAGHCHGSCSDRVFVGEDVERPGDGTIIEVEDAVRHPDYDDNELRNDLAVLILAEDAAAQPRSLAADGMLEAAGSVRLAGYGNTDVDSMGGYGIRRMVDVPLASNDPKFGSDAKTEFVPARPLWSATAATATAAGLPYVASDDRWYVVGATSRATASAIRRCGDGGIYTRVGVFADWIRSIPGGRWN